MASYKQLSKYNWKVTVSLGFEGGKRTRVAKQGFRTKADAEKYVTELKQQQNKGYVPTSENNIPFKDFILKWYEDYKKHTLGISTRASYTGRINNYIIPALGDYKIRDITPSVMQEFYNSLIDKMKPASIEKIFQILISCFKYARKQKLIYELPTDIDKVKVEAPKVEFWEDKELNIFLDRIKGTYLYNAIFIDSLTGLRVAELCGLRWCNIDLKKGYINVNSQVIYDREEKKLLFTEILKTDSSNRKVSIPPKTLGLYLKNLKDEIKPLDNDFVVPDRNGSMANPRNLSMDFTKKLEKYEDLKQISFHGLRHTHATMLLRHGENVKVVSARLGHKDITTTLNTYMHVIPDMEANTATLLDNIFLNNQEDTPNDNNSHKEE